MIDPSVSLAFSVYTNKGVYALLLGSGISRSSGIPTGWEVTTDLIKKVAALHGDECDDAPEVWYRSKYGKEPSYSDLLEAIAVTSAERQRLLMNYFEPTAEESEKGLKAPTQAHKAIARLVRDGYIKLIITTNFDKLIERALEQEGVTPIVVSTPDQLKGAVPLRHASVMVLKINGDYMDLRLRNTEAELRQYEEELERLLDVVFDEYGLIVSGWSAQWDAGLVKSLERAKNRRFPTYWTALGDLAQEAERLVNHRSASVVRIRDADSFFDDLGSKVSTLQQMSARHPVTGRLAAALVKKHLSSEGGIISLHDLVRDEREKLYFQLRAPDFKSDCKEDALLSEVRSRIGKYNQLSELLLTMTLTGSYWDRPDADRIWIDAVQRIGGTESGGGYSALLNLRRYPAMLLFYAMGIASIAGGNLSFTSRFLSKAKLRSHETGKDEPLYSSLCGLRVIEDSLVRHVFEEFRQKKFPVSALLRRELRPILQELIPGESEFEYYFDFWEYLLGMLYMEWSNEPWAPMGEFFVHSVHSHEENRIWSKFDKEYLEHGPAWALLSGGLFGGSSDRLASAKAKYDAFLKNMPRM
jgi:hypothetical protein